MDDRQAKKLGAYLQNQRLARGFGVRQLAKAVDTMPSWILRLEDGVYQNPGADKLARIAETLGLNLADVYAMAGYAVPSELPSPALYLRSKFKNLNERQLLSLTKDLDDMLARHGVDPSQGPSAGEDEEPEPTTIKNLNTKGGNS